MLNVSYAGPRGFPVVMANDVPFVMEHKFTMVPSQPAVAMTLDAEGNPEGLLHVELAPFWLFGFGPHQIECLYQGPCPLPEDVLARAVPALREAVREELATGQSQLRTI